MMTKPLLSCVAVLGIAFTATACSAQPAADAAPVARIGEMSVSRAEQQATRLSSGKVLVTGGCTGRCDATLAQAERFDPASGRFRTIAPMTVARGVPVAAALADGRVLISGGQTAEMTPLDSAEIFDPTTGRFTAIESMHSARLAHTAVALHDGRVLTMGGLNARRGEVLRSAEIFDPATGGFSAGPDMHSQRYKLPDGAVRLPSGDVLVAAGAAQIE